jgi:ABC-type polysaccharide/polyol phosphate transport system ATPase subunit
MSSTAIRAEGIGKRYRIGAAAVRHHTLRSAIAYAAGAPLRNLRRLRQLGRLPASNATDVVWALRDVSFRLPQGEVLGVLGRNGAGKSTLLKILSRVTEPTTGCADVQGRVGSLLEVGTGFHPELTGRDNVYLNGSILGMDRKYIDRRFDEIVEFAEIGRLLDTPVKHYSSGMYLRLAFAVAAHLEPEILMVDEVLAVGDVAFQRKCLGRMDAVVRDGRTILFVSHNMDAVQRLCSQCILIEGGRLAAHGPAAEIVGRYLASGNSDAPPLHWIDLSRAARSGTGGARLAGAWYSGLDRAWAHCPHPLGPVEIRLSVTSLGMQQIGGIAVWIADRHGAKLVVGHTGALRRLLALDAGQHEVRTRIRQLYLNPGSYWLGLCLVDHRGDVLDQVDAAFPLEVVGSRAQAFGMRRLPDGVIPCEFELLEPGGGSDHYRRLEAGLNVVEDWAG